VGYLEGKGWGIIWGYLGQGISERFLILGRKLFHLKLKEPNLFLFFYGNSYFLLRFGGGQVRRAL